MLPIMNQPCLLCSFCAWLVAFGMAVGSGYAATPGFESLGIPVRVGGLMGCIVGPNGHGGEALFFNFNQLSGKLFLVQVDPETGEARQFNAPEDRVRGRWRQGRTNASILAPGMEP